MSFYDYKRKVLKHIIVDVAFIRKTFSSKSNFKKEHRLRALLDLDWSQLWPSLVAV